jgi:zinc protease
VSLSDCEAALVTELDRIAREGITEAELAKAKAQLRARLVFDNDSVTNIAHQIGYFETIGAKDLFDTLTERLPAVDLTAVNGIAASLLKPANRTIGWFEPMPPGSERIDFDRVSAGPTGPVSE